MKPKHRITYILGTIAVLLITVTRFIIPNLQDETIGLYVQGIGVVIFAVVFLIEAGIKYDEQQDRDEQEDRRKEETEEIFKSD